jgi:hypothetical protein
MLAETLGWLSKEAQTALFDPWLGKEEADRDSAPASVWAGETIFSGKGGDAR